MQLRWMTLIRVAITVHICSDNKNPLHLICGASVDAYIEIRPLDVLLIFAYLKIRLDFFSSFL